MSLVRVRGIIPLQELWHFSIVYLDLKNYALKNDPSIFKGKVILANREVESLCAAVCIHELTFLSAGSSIPALAADLELGCGLENFLRNVKNDQFDTEISKKIFAISNGLGIPYIPTPMCKKDAVFNRPNIDKFIIRAHIVHETCLKVAVKKAELPNDGYISNIRHELKEHNKNFNTDLVYSTNKSLIRY